MHTARPKIAPLAWLLGCLWLVALTARATPAGHRTPRPDPIAGSRPNIVFIMSDDQGYGELSCHGNPILRTPHLDRLHAQSLRFTSYHVSPTCAPTRSALLTGRHEFRNGVTHTIFERERLRLDAVTLAEVLRSAGYSTGIFGKWHLGDEDDHLPERRGFDRVLIHGGGGIGQTFPGSCGDAPDNQYHDPVLWNGRAFEKTRGYCTDVFFDRAGDWLAEAGARGKPFFAMVTPNAPHDPFVIPSEEWAAPYRGLGLSTNAVAYYSMIAHLDAAVGRLLARIDAQPWGRDTLVIFQTDNGHSVDGLFNAGMRGMKGTPYEGGIRVPAFWRWPARLPAGVDCAALTAHVDVFPTLAALAGADLGPLRRQVEGRSLLPLLADPGAPWADRLLVTHFGRGEYGEAAAARHRLCAIRDRRFKLVNHRELYDLQADPGERTDLSGAHPEVVARLRASYDAWWTSVLPETEENDRALGPYLNPFKQRYWDQFGLPRDPGLVGRMDPVWKFVRPRPR
ncbi:MAG: arylsulfatase [Verrucomicrobium sp.]|nr:arylsulfatase [Verrucomicrobium sp.]